jgi:hypothetical protein
MRATQPSGTASNARTTGPQGTPGGKATRRKMGAGSMNINQSMYLWILVVIEVALLGGFRRYFRKFHGG